MSTERSCELHQQEYDSSEEDEEQLYTAAAEDEQDGGEEDQDLCRCERNYQDLGNEKKVLYLMCIGLKSDNGTPLFSFECEPWSLLPKTALRPKNNDFVKEIGRRSNDYNISPMPRPRNWTRQQIMEWLERNPMQESADIAFLTKEVQRVREVLLSAQSAEEGNNPQSEAPNGSVGRGRSWRGPIPYLRIIMCLTYDNVKSLFLNRANARTRHEIDARNSENRYDHDDAE